MGAMDYYLGGAAATKKWLAAFFLGIDDAEAGEMEMVSKKGKADTAKNNQR